MQPRLKKQKNLAAFTLIELLVVIAIIAILVESVVIALLGALAGVAASFGLVKILTMLAPTGNTPVITSEAMILGVLFSAAVGVAAGLFPAM